MLGDLLVGLLALLVGTAICFAGLRYWFALLPLWGFVAGFFAGATAFTAIFGDGFLSTVTGWVVGAVVGTIFGAMSYFLWYFGAILAAGSLGSLLGSGLMSALDVNNRWLVFFVALGGALLFTFIALAMALPVYIVIVNTAGAGAVAITAGVMLILNRIDRAELTNGAAWSVVQESWFWVLVAGVLFVMGLMAQLATLRSVVLPEDRWVTATPVTATV